MEAKTGNEEVEVLKDDIAKLREDIASLASAVLGAASDTLGDTLDDAKAKVSGKSQQARDEFSGKIDDGLERGKQFLDDLDAQVTRHPVGSVLVAFGVGLLIAKLLGSGNSR
jgi:ElaB/YqjD/DUF883 family membrane-anchored ribosome-binding protein